MRYRISLLSTWVDSIDLSEAGDRVAGFVRDGAPHQIVPANVDFLRLASEDEEFRELVNGADMVVADGMPLVWAARWAGHHFPRRISGVDMILTCAEAAVERGFSMFFLGAAPGVGEDVAEVLQARFPGLRIAGVYAPPPLPLTEEEDQKVVRLVQEAQPDMLLVAFGAPLQEQWIRAHMHYLGVPVCMGVGGAFDMLSGRVRRAPLWMQGRGLEWFYRLVQEPRRLWRRYLIHDLPVFVRLMLHSRRDRARPQPANTVRLVEDVLPDLARVEESSARVG